VLDVEVVATEETLLPGPPDGWLAAGVDEPLAVVACVVLIVWLDVKVETLTSPPWLEVSPALVDEVSSVDVLVLVAEMLMLELDEVETDWDAEVDANTLEAVPSVDGPPLIGSVLLCVVALLCEAVKAAEVEEIEALELVESAELIMVLELPNELSLAVNTEEDVAITEVVDVIEMLPLVDAISLDDSELCDAVVAAVDESVALVLP
jgi:hypothetical protein